MNVLSALHLSLSSRTRALALGACLSIGATSALAEQATTQAISPSAATVQTAPIGAPLTTGDAQTQTSAEAQPQDALPTDLPTEEQAAPLAHDLSPWGMYQAADRVVKSVMIGLLLASILTWAIWIAKGLELIRAKSRLRKEIATLKQARTLKQAVQSTANSQSFSALLVDEAQNEIDLSAHSQDKDAIKERVSFRLDRLVAASGRQMSQGTGILATIGSVGPFVGLFGTVWGIMNSFIGIAKSQTTNLAVVAPGIAEALLATALGLVAAIPAVVIYNVFARSIAGYKAHVADACAQVLLLVSRDLDYPSAQERANVAAVSKVS